MVESTMITALVELATNEFADKDAMNKVINLLNESKNNLIASLAKEVSDDARAEKECADELKSKGAFINTCRIGVSDATKALDTTNDNITASLAFLARRKADLAKNQKDLGTENTTFDATTKSYEDLVAQI